ncbi:uncharacterized protein LOC34623855 [Cyclospora cayetanensis]|uniref:Uncharacterized protein LOC34623855 n=1 Tax=Cyclospora cayetanensis TaxID=88456 RepID=A0A6P6RX44_9EIME|nr:uncharacterized protein LOC34623855 [Cyclospora cayetanensis]
MKRLSWRCTLLWLKYGGILESSLAAIVVCLDTRCSVSELTTGLRNKHGAVFYTNATDEASAGRILARSLISAPLDKAHGDQSQWIYFDDLTTVDQADLMLLTSGPVNGTSAPPQNNLPLPLDLLSAHIDDASKGQRSADTYSLHSPWLERRSDEAMGTSSVHEAFIPPIMETEEEYGGALKRADNTAPSLPLFVDSGLMPPEAFQSTGQLSHQAFVVESESKETATSQAMEEQSQREVGYIVGSAYSGPEFRLQETPAFEKPPVFAMQNITLLPDQYRKPIAAALRSFTARMQEAAVEYCKKNHLNCTQEEALHTAISVAIRTSPVASMFRQISASLSALEGAVTGALRPLGWPLDPRSPENPPPPPKPPAETTAVVQFAFSLVGTAVALLRGLIHVTQSSTPLAPGDTHLHEHHRYILLNILLAGRETTGCSLTAPPNLTSNCKTFLIEVRARTDNRRACGAVQGGNVKSLTVHGFELSCLSSLKCTQHFTLRQPYNLDGDYTVVSSSGGVLEFEKKVSNDSLQPIASSWKLYLYQPASHPDVKGPLKSAVVACSPLPVRSGRSMVHSESHESPCRSLMLQPDQLPTCKKQRLHP